MRTRAIRSKITLGLIVLFGLLKAQPDPLSYYVVLKNDSAFSCKVPYQVPNKMIRVKKKEDNQEEIILWRDIASISVVDSGKKINLNNLSKKDLKTMREKEKTKTEHSKWVNCFLVMQNGDTVYGKIRDRVDFSSYMFSLNADELWPTDSLRLLRADDQEIRFSVIDLRELNLEKASPDYKKYLIVDGFPYRVIMDGKCKLLYNQTEYVTIDNSMPSTRNAVGSYSFSQNDYERYFLQKPPNQDEDRSQ
jgi:hypothetical protein